MGESPGLPILNRVHKHPSVEPLWRPKMEVMVRRKNSQILLDKYGVSMPPNRESQVLGYCQTHEIQIEHTHSNTHKSVESKPYLPNIHSHIQFGYPTPRQRACSSVRIFCCSCCVPRRCCWWPPRTTTTATTTIPTRVLVACVTTVHLHPTKSSM